MKRLTLLLIIFCTIGTYSASTWADLVYQCTGETGEASFSSRPCDSGATGEGNNARYAAHDERLEQVKSEKVALKRQLMDLKREYYYALAHVSVDDEPALTLEFEQQAQLILDEIELLDDQQTRLVGKSFDELIQAKVGE